MRLLIFGANGMLGHKLIQRLGGDFDVFGTIRGTFDAVGRYGIFNRERTICGVAPLNADSIENALNNVRPDVVINAIGVIKQVPNAKDVINTLSVNSIFPHRLADASAHFGFRLLTISTDCVFDGKKGNYNEDDIPNATDLYGKSKNLGEVTGPNCLTVRTSIIGRELASAHSLVEWVLSNRGKQIQGFTNAIYSGFPTIVFADIIARLMIDHKELSGLYHIASSPISKFDLVTLINRYYQAGIDIVPSGDFHIDRSLNASRFNALTGFVPEPWDEMVRRMASDPTPYDQWRK